MLDTFLYGTGCLLILAKFLGVPALVAIPTALLGALAVSINVGRELARLAGERDTDAAGEDKGK
jgi:hypothetical protein